MSKTFTHNGLFEVDMDSVDINTAEYVDFKRYTELVDGESSLCITITRDMRDDTSSISVTHEVDGNHHEIAYDPLTEQDFVELTGFRLVDEGEIIDNGNKHNTPALPYGNVIEKGYYYE